MFGKQKVFRIGNRLACAGDLDQQCIKVTCLFMFICLSRYPLTNNQAANSMEPLTNPRIPQISRGCNRQSPSYKVSSNLDDLPQWLPPTV